MTGLARCGRRGGAALALAWALIAGGAVCAQSTKIDLMKLSVPVGAAADDEQTSHGIDQILAKSAAFYESVSTVKITGDYVYTSKGYDDETSGPQYSLGDISIAYRRPRQFSVVVKSDSSDVDSAFYADGKTVTFASAEEDAYITLPQKDSLAAYVEEYRVDGDIFNEYSGALNLVSTPVLLISEDPLMWLYRGVTHSYYEGEDTLRGIKHHRIRFMIEGGYVMNIWVNAGTGFITRCSWIYGYDEDYDSVASFEEAKYGTLSVVDLRIESLKASSVKDADFKARIPKGYKKEKDEPVVESTRAQKSWWENMVDLAAESSPEETTWTLTRNAGEWDFAIEPFVQLSDADALFTGRTLPGRKPELWEGPKNGELRCFNADGDVSTTLKLPTKVSRLTIGMLPNGEPMLVTADEGRYQVIAYDEQANELWRYHHPFTTINQITTRAPFDSGTYVLLSDGNGARMLDAEGRVRAATTEKKYVTALPRPTSADEPVVARVSLDLAIFDKNLKMMRTGFETDNLVGVPRWDRHNATFPLVYLCRTSDWDYMLQRAATDGDLAWSVMVEPKAEDAQGGRFEWLNVTVNGQTTRCALVLLPNGTLAVISPEGRTLYRGQIAANDAVVKRSDDAVVQGSAMLDMNEDGIEELYTRIGDQIVRLTPRLP